MDPDSVIEVNVPLLGDWTWFDPESERVSGHGLLYSYTFRTFVSKSEGRPSVSQFLMAHAHGLIDFRTRVFQSRDTDLPARCRESIGSSITPVSLVDWQIVPTERGAWLVDPGTNAIRASLFERKLTVKGLSESGQNQVVTIYETEWVPTIVGQKTGLTPFNKVEHRAYLRRFDDGNWRLEPPNFTR